MNATSLDALRAHARDTLREGLDALARTHSDETVELFLRASRRIRAAGEAGGALAHTVEHGAAIRRCATGDAGAATRFAATTSWSAAGLVETSSRASAGAPAPDRFPLRRRVHEPSADLAPADLPTPERLTAWRADLGDRIARAASDRVAIEECAVEVAGVVERIGTTAGLDVERVRRRAWCVVEFVYRGPRARGRRAFVRAVPDDGGLPRLDGLEAWVAALDAMATSPPPGADAGLYPWRLAPAAAAVLVRAVAGVLHLGTTAETDVGAGWCLEHRPAAPDALASRSFDDVGHPTAAVGLADGRRGVPVAIGTGLASRPSYRDRPEPRFGHLEVTARGGGPPGPAVEVLDLRILPLGPVDWVLDGLARMPDGSAARLRRRMAPADIAARCVGSAGEPAATSDDVLTPALFLDAPGDGG